MPLEHCMVSVKRLTCLNGVIKGLWSSCAATLARVKSLRQRPAAEAQMEEAGRLWVLRSTDCRQ